MTGDQLPGSVRALDLSDLPACQAVALTRDWTDSEAKWRLLLTAGDGFGIDDPDGGLAGVVVLTRYPPNVAVVGMLIVAARHARRGEAQLGRDRAPSATPEETRTQSSPRTSRANRQLRRRLRARKRPLPEANWAHPGRRFM